MSEFDVREVHAHVDPEAIIHDLGLVSYADLTLEEAQVAAEAISRLRIPFVVDAIQAEIERRHMQMGDLRAAFGTAEIIDLEDFIPDEEEFDWYVGTADVRQAILEDGKFVDFEDFLNVREQVRTTNEYITNLFHTLVLFMLQDDPEKYAEARQQLRYNPYSHSSNNPFAATRRFFLRAELLMPFATEKVGHEYKISGVGRTGRRVLRAVLFDDMNIEDLLLEERVRFDR